MQRLLTFIAILVASFPALAGETSRSNILGFSQDGTYFAFEEFGVTDGSGTPYASVFIINTTNDSWVKGTPIRKFGDEQDGQDVEQRIAELGITDRFLINQQFEKALINTREEVLKKSAPIIKGFAPLYPGTKRVSNSPFEFSTDAKSVRFSLIDYEQVLNNGTDEKVMRLDVAGKKFPAGEKCYGFYPATYGYTLTLTNEKTGNTEILNDDTKVPSSRGCPQGYQIEDVISFRGSSDKIVLAILLRYSTVGFEGPDGRLIAVTTQISQQ